MKMGARYIYLTNNTETNNNHWNITFDGLSNIQAQNTQYGLLCIQANDPSKGSINFKNVNVNATTLNAGYGDGAVNVTFSGNNVLKGELTSNNSLVQANNLEIKDGTTTVTLTATNATSATSFSVAGNAIIDSNAKLNITSNADNVAGITFTAGAGSQTIDNATIGVLRLKPNAQATMDLGAGVSMAVMRASDIDLQNGSQLDVNTKMDTTGFRALAPIEIDSTQNDVMDSTVRIAKDAKLSIIRSGVAKSDSPLLSMGPNDGLGNNYHLLVDGGSLDLQDSANSDLWPSTATSSNYSSGWPGILTTWGTSSTNQVQFTNPKLVNIVRTNVTSRGSYLIHLDSAGSRKSSLQINSADSEYITPITMRTAGSTEPTTWNIKYLSNVSQGGDWAYSFQKLTDNSTNYYNYGSEYMNHAENVPVRGNNEVILATVPSDTGYNRFSGGNYIDNNGNKVSLLDGQSKASQALNNFINHFSWWNGSGVTFGSELQQKNEYQPTYEGTQVKQGQEVTTKAPSFKNADNQDVDAPKGVEFALGANEPAWVKSISDKGAITVAPTSQTNVGLYNIPVKVTYSDGTIDNVVAPIYVGDATHTIEFGNRGAVAVTTNVLLLHQTTAQSMNVDANQTVKEFDVYTPDSNDPTVLNTTPEKFIYKDGQFIDGVKNLGGRDLVKWNGEFSTVTSPVTLSTPKNGNITITFSENTLPVSLGIFTANYKVNTNISTTLVGAVLNENAKLTISKGETPDSTQLKSLVDNSKLDTLPSSIKAISYELVPGTDTNKVGKQDLAIRIIFNDKDINGNNTYLDLAPVKDGLEVIQDKTDAEQNDPEGQDITTNLNQVPVAKNGIKNITSLTNVQSIAWSDEAQVKNDVKTAGTYNEAITVTYNDGSKDTVEIKLTVIDNRTDAEKYAPEGNPITITKGDKVPDPAEGIKNKGDLPAGTNYTWDVAPDPEKVGKQTVVVNVKYPDGSQDKVTTTVTVIEPADADKYAPEGQDINTKTGVMPAPAEGIKNKDDLPEGTTYTWKDTPDVTTPGDKPATVVVTYPDGSKDEVPVTIHVTNPSTDADKYAPQGQPVTTDQGVVPDAKEGIANLGDLGTPMPKIAWANPEQVKNDVQNPGTYKDVVITVTYPDGSQDTVKVDLTVTEPTPTIKDSDTYEPSYQPVSTTVNNPVTATPSFTENGQVVSIENVPVKNFTLGENDPAAGATIDPTTGVVTVVPAKSGNYTIPVTVTYDDGSVDHTTITVKVTNGTKVINPGDEGTTDDMFKTTTRKIIVNNPYTGKEDVTTQNVQFQRSKTVDAVTGETISYGKWTVKPGTSDVWASFAAPEFAGYVPETTNIPAETVTDKTKDVTVIISYNPTDATKYTAEGGNITVDKGHKLTDGDAADAIVNKADLPAGTKYTWKEAPDTSVVGERTGVVSVTYPDGSVDEVPVMVHITDDANKYTPEGQPITIKQGEPVPNPADGIKNKPDLPAGTKYTWDVAPDPAKVGEQPVVINVTYPDGSQDQVPTTVIVTEPTIPTPDKTDADKYDPEGQVVTVNKGEQLPAASEGIANKEDLPQGTKYEWKTPVDTTTSGDKPAVITVTYPDGSVDEVPTTVHVNLTDADKYSPEGQNIEVNKGTQVPDASTAITNVPDLPKNTTYTWETTPDTNKVGEQPAVVVVTYPDGSKDTVPVIITVKNPTTPTPDKTDADKNDPRGGTIEATLGENLANKASEGIINKNELTNVKSYTWTNGTPSTTITGLTMQSVTVTYNDGSTDVVPVYVNVTSDADKYSPEPAVVTVKPGKMPDPADGIKNKNELPDGTKYSWKVPVDTTTPGDKPAVVVVTYPDGSKDEVPTVVHVTKPTDADENTPITQPIHTVKGQVPDPTDGIKNIKDLPSGTKVNWTDPDKVAQDVNTTGDHDETVVVTYPDGSKDTVTVTVKVTDDIKPMPYDKDNAAMNSTVTRTITVINPDGTKNIATQTAKFTRDGVEINGVAHYNAWQPATQTLSAVTINQIKGYTAKVSGDAGEVTVNGDSADMTVEISYQANQPVGQEITTNKGQLPAPGDGIKNKDDLPDGTKYEWKDTPDVDTTGDKTATVVVTTPDGTKTDVTVTIHVQPTDADKYTPETQPVITPNGQVPNADTTIKNLGALPSGTKVDWADPDKVAQDVKHDGTHSETVVVTYPDGSKDVVTVTVKAVTPQGQGISTNQGQLPNPADAIKNKDQLPEGTKYVWKQAPDVNTLGDHTGVVEVIFPDGATYDVTVQVHVLAGANSNGDSNENGGMNSGASGAGTGVNNGNSTNSGDANLNTGTAANVNNGQLSAGNSAATNNNGSQQATKKLPQTGNDLSKLSALAGLSLASLAGILGFAGHDKKRKADK
ncbi:LPXTG cell wall anchor domain-containing protein [Lactobacillus sp. 0.1XD8-4]|nr:LPXTG cell wall anchor domain-containing protein [Lactobacillus sp. 0.1XD8-4]